MRTRSLLSPSAMSAPRLASGSEAAADSSLITTPSSCIASQARRAERDDGAALSTRSLATAGGGRSGARRHRLIVIHDAELREHGDVAGAVPPVCDPVPLVDDHGHPVRGVEFMLARHEHAVAGEPLHQDRREARWRAPTRADAPVSACGPEERQSPLRAKLTSTGPSTEWRMPSAYRSRWRSPADRTSKLSSRSSTTSWNCCGCVTRPRGRGHPTSESSSRAPERGNLRPEDQDFGRSQNGVETHIVHLAHSRAPSRGGPGDGWGWEPSHGPR